MHEAGTPDRELRTPRRSRADGPYSSRTSVSSRATDFSRATNLTFKVSNHESPSSRQNVCHRRYGTRLPDNAALAGRGSLPRLRERQGLRHHHEGQDWPEVPPVRVCRVRAALQRHDGHAVSRFALAVYQVVCGDGAHGRSQEGHHPRIRLRGTSVALTRQRGISATASARQWKS